MNWKVLVAGLVPVVALVGVLASGFGKDPKALPSMLEGKAAPPFELITLDGETISLESLKGKPVVLNYWATWCRPCVQEHPVLLQASQVYGPRGVQFIGILYGDEAENASAWLAREGQAYPTLLDPGQRGAIMGLYSTMTYLCVFAAPFAGDLLFGLWGLIGCLLVSAALAILEALEAGVSLRQPKTKTVGINSDPASPGAPA